MKIKDLCASERPREKMLSRGADSLGNGELLAVLIRSGDGADSALDLASKLLNSFDGKLTRLFNASPDTLCAQKGIGPGKACCIVAAAELGRRFLSEQSQDGITLISARMVYDLLIPRLKGLKHEECWVLLLDEGHRLIHKQMLSLGGSKSTVIDIRLLMALALEKKASGLILAHNHPSGNPEPSGADAKQTEALHKAASACGLFFLDHVVICDNSFFSFADGREYRA